MKGVFIFDVIFISKEEFFFDFEIMKIFEESIFDILVVEKRLLNYILGFRKLYRKII